MAETGRFDEVLDRLNSSGLPSQDEQAAQLVHFLERYKQHVTHFGEIKKQSHEKSLEDMANNLEEDKIDEALINAIEAHATADSPDELLEDQRIKDMVAKVEEEARTEETDGNWLEAMNLYRRLNLLYEPKEPYRSQVRRLEQQVRVLRIYAPDKLNAMFLEAAAKHGNEDAKAPIMEDQEANWEQRLDRVRSDMLYESLQFAVANHVDGPTYRDMLSNAIERLVIMVQTRGLEAAFESLSDAEAVTKFVDGVESIKQQMVHNENLLGRFDAKKYLDQVLTINRVSINLPQKVMIYELAEGAFAGLDDFTAVIWPYDLSQFERNTQGVFYGVGIQIAISDNRLTVVSPLPGTPAHRAGIKPGDVIVKVDGKDTSHWTLNWAVREITGPEGTQVTLSVERKSAKDPIDFPLTRSRIKIESVQGWKRNPSSETGWDFYIDRDDRIGYVRISQFIPQTTDDLDRAIKQMKYQEDGLNALILDLRYNPGGLLKQSVDVVDRFVRQGTIVSTVRVNGEVTSSFTAQRHRTYSSLPVVVIVNQGSASASEIVSGALQDHQKAVVIGERSFGKGSVQDILPLMGSQAALKLTSHYYQLPLGRQIHRKPNALKWGVEPDMVVPMIDQQVADAIEARRQADVLRSPDDPVDPEAEEPAPVEELIESGTDLQLEAAVLVLKTKLFAATTELPPVQQAAHPEAEKAAHSDN